MFANFHQLTDFLRRDLHWDLQDFAFEDLVYEWSPSEIGVRTEHVDKISSIHQLRTVHPSQPWSVFFVRIDTERSKIQPVRDILGSLVSLRSSALLADDTRTTYQSDEILFWVLFGSKKDPSLAVLWFEKSPNPQRPLTRLISVATSDPQPRKLRVSEILKRHLRWPFDPANIESWRTQWQKAFVQEIETPDVLRQMEKAIIEYHLNHVDRQKNLPEKHIHLLLQHLNKCKILIEKSLIDLNESRPLYESIIHRIREKTLNFRRLIDHRRVASIHDFFQSLEEVKEKINFTSAKYSLHERSNALELLMALLSHHEACQCLPLKWSVIRDYVYGERIQMILSEQKSPVVMNDEALSDLRIAFREYQTLENTIILGCHDWVAEIGREKPETSGIDLEDLISAGMIGVYQAMQSYDHTVNSSFRHYAYWRVQRQMNLAIETMRDFVKVPSEPGVEKLVLNLKERFVLLTGRISKDILHFFEQNRIPYHRRQLLITKLRILAGNHVDLYGTIPAKMQVTDDCNFLPACASELDSYEFRGRILRIVNSLKKIEKEVIEMRFGFGYGYIERVHDSVMTYSQIARKFNCSTERIRQIEAKALMRLRHPSRIKFLFDYSPK